MVMPNTPSNGYEYNKCVCPSRSCQDHNMFEAYSNMFSSFVFLKLLEVQHINKTKKIELN